MAYCKQWVIKNINIGFILVFSSQTKSPNKTKNINTGNTIPSFA